MPCAPDLLALPAGHATPCAHQNLPALGPCRSADLPSSQLLSPAFSAAVAPDPLVEPAGAQQGPHAGQLPDTFLAVGLHSSLTSIPRPDLNLCILLDASGSMAAPFRSFYYGGCEPQPGVATLPGAGPLPAVSHLCAAQCMHADSPPAVRPS